MTLDEAIKHCEEVADADCYSDEQLRCSEEHSQLAGWLKKLRDYENTGLIPEEIEGLKEKQTPKKVLYRQRLRNFNNEIYAIRGNCPECGLEELLSTSTDYCYLCGQRLDWN